MTLPEAGPSPASSPFPKLAAAVACAVLVGFAVFVIALIVLRDTHELVWGRLVWVFTSVEAITFGAAGFLFGASIQRQRAEAAEAAAEKNAQDAQNGQRLAASAEAMGVVTGQGAGAPGVASLGPGSSSAAAALVSAHVDLARELFPR